MKGKKLAFAVILALIVCLVLIPVSAYAEGEEPATPVPDTPVTLSDPEPTVTSTTPDPDVPQPPTAEEEAAATVVEVETETDLETAVTDVATDTIVKVTEDITVPSTSTGDAQPISVAATEEETVIVIDLGGKEISSANHHDSSTDVFSFEKGKITVRNGTINGNIRVQDSAKVYLDPTLVLNGFVFVKGDTNGTTDPQLNVNCEINNDTVDEGYAVATNGSLKGGKITVSENAQLSAAKGAAIFLPSGSMTINGGTITGATGIYMKAGSLTLNGGTITATGEHKAFVHNDDGLHSTGDAITVVYASKTYGTIDGINFNGGTISSRNGAAISEYQVTGDGQKTAEKLSATGGVYSDDTFKNYVADGNVVVKVGEQYGVNESAFELGYIAAENGEVIEILDAPDGMEIDGVIPGVKFVNKSGNDVFVNGVKIAAGETYTVPGAEFTYTEAYTAKYFVVDGEEQEWTKGSADGLSFKLNSEDVIKVLIDGVEVEFTVENGEIVISAEVLEALEAGEHEIEFVFADGSCKTEFTVK